VSARLDPHAAGGARLSANAGGEGEARPSRRAWILRCLGFQPLWPAAVLPAAAGLAWPGVLAGCAFATGHLLATRAEQRGAELALVALSVALGLVFESAVGALELVDYRAGWSGVAWLAPPWILALWAAVGSLWTTLLRWMRRSLVLAAAVGAVGGTLSLGMGAAVGAVELAEPRAWVPAVGLQWALTTPLLVALSRRLVP